MFALSIHGANKQNYPYLVADQFLSVLIIIKIFDKGINVQSIMCDCKVCEFVCMCSYRLNAHVYVCVHACMYACVCACMRACVRACMRACVRACMRIPTCMCVAYY